MYATPIGAFVKSASSTAKPCLGETPPALDSSLKSLPVPARVLVKVGTFWSALTHVDPERGTRNTDPFVRTLALKALSTISISLI